jgi:hypothetical protein
MPTSGNRELSAGWVNDEAANIEKCAKAIRQARGVIKDAAGILGIGRSTLWRYIGLHPELAAELEAMRKAHHGRTPLWDSVGEAARKRARKTRKAAEAARSGKAGG